jgi:hypothetical protein
MLGILSRERVGGQRPASAYLPYVTDWCRRVRDVPDLRSLSLRHGPLEADPARPGILTARER